MTSASVHSGLFSAFLGILSGGRSVAGVSALAWSAGHPYRKVLAVCAAGELLADKLPITPSRLGVPQVFGRIGAGAVCGVLIARRNGVSLLLCAVLGAAAAYAGAVAGARWRKWAADQFGSDIYGALIEDATVVAGQAIVAGELRR